MEYLYIIACGGAHSQARGGTHDTLECIVEQATAAEACTEHPAEDGGLWSKCQGLSAMLDSESHSYAIVMPIQIRTPSVYTSACECHHHTHAPATVSLPITFIILIRDKRAAQNAQEHSL